VRVGVEEAIDEQLLVEDLGQLGRDRVGVEAERRQRVLLADLDAVHERHRQHGLAAPRRVTVGNSVSGSPAKFGHARDAARLVGQVGLARQHVGELLVDALDLVDRHERLVDLERPAQHPQIDADDVGDVGVEHLDRQPLAVGGAGLVDLAERRRGDRRLLEAGERRLGRLAERLLERLGDRRGTVGRHLVLQALELLGVRPRQERAHDRQDLAELDVDAAQPDEALVHAARVLAVDLLPALGGAVAPRPQPRERQRPQVAQEDHPEHARRANQADRRPHQPVTRCASSPCTWRDGSTRRPAARVVASRGPS
jgi:hypothetical protein